MQTHAPRAFGGPRGSPWWDRPPLEFFSSKSGQSGQMTMPARRAPKFSAKRCAILLDIVFQSWISEGFP